MSDQPKFKIGDKVLSPCSRSDPRANTDGPLKKGKIIQFLVDGSSVQTPKVLFDDGTIWLIMSYEGAHRIRLQEPPNLEDRIADYILRDRELELNDGDKVQSRR
jgi:hypothetical protein